MNITAAPPGHGALASSWIANNVLATSVTVALIAFVTFMYRVIRYRDAVVKRVSVNLLHGTLHQADERSIDWISTKSSTQQTLWKLDFYGRDV
jgi:hypothetical protein